MKCSNCGAGLTSPAGVSLTVCPFCNTDNSAKKQAAASGGEAALREEFLQRGESLYRNSRVLSSLISDLFADNQRLVKILQVAVRENLAAKIAELTVQSVSEQKTRISALLSIFASDYGMDKTRAAEAVRVLAFGAGIADEVLDGLVYVVDDSGSPPHTPQPQIGSVHSFGNMRWYVLCIQNGKALLLSKNILEHRPYHNKEDSYTAITWEKCILRQHLNGEFLNEFSQADRGKIIQTPNLNRENQWFGTPGGKNTDDYIFLLSLEEVVKYFGDSGQLKNRPNSNSREIDDQYNSARIATSNGTAHRWLLRSPGGAAYLAANVSNVGYVGVSGFFAAGSGGVRPALWLKL